MLLRVFNSRGGQAHRGLALEVLNLKRCKLLVWLKESSQPLECVPSMHRLSLSP